MGLSHNLQWSESVIGKLKSSGVRLFCVCPGARNAALIEILSRQNDVSVKTFVDERSAGFFALGHALEKQEPVVVCTTSGTAVAELLSATIEAFHVGAPLVLLTADRPRRFRGRGAPQAIDQLEFMKSHVHQQWDLVDGKTDFEISGTGPVQINLCFEEPILGNPASFKDNVPKPAVGDQPLIILGSLTDSEKHFAKGFLQTNPGYYLAESHSGLCGLKLDSGMTAVPSHVVNADNFTNWFDSVIRIGGVPSLRLWRDLEHKLSHIPVMSYSGVSLSGLGREETCPKPVSDLKDLQLKPGKEFPELNDSFSHWEKRRGELLLELPKSELAMVGKLSELLPAKAKVFLGNSLPVREWDTMALSRSDLQVRSQRGVNGIDGLISTFFGRLDPMVENVLLIGDLSTIYDSNAWWVWKQALGSPKDLPAKIVVINNGGGRIFRRLFENPALQSEHDFEFSELARLFEWNYFRWTHCSQMTWEGLPEQCLIELQPSLEESDSAWSRLRE